MNLISIPAFNDNYIWLLHNKQGKCLIVDPGDSAPVLTAIQQHHWQPEAIFLTHHHQDHTGGVMELVRHYPGLPVYGPGETRAKGASHLVNHGQTIRVLDLCFQVLTTPGHTAHHVCYYSAPWLFSGDTLFSGGCGRLFEGSAAQMYQSLQTLNQLPADTLICCGHEYTLSNLRFAISILPDDQELAHYYQKVEKLRENNQQTVPSTLQTEREINLFLRVNDIDFISKIGKEFYLMPAEQRFAWLRAKKDHC